jgi:hypothetical protein
MTMAHIGRVNGEGGPFLLADARAIRVWGGNESGDYDALCQALSAAGPTWGIPWSLGPHDATVWEPEGPGTAEVFAPSSDSLVLVRGLAFAGDWDRGIEAAASAPVGEADKVGEIALPSGTLVILWSPENGASVPDADIDQEKSRAVPALVLENSCLFTKVQPGRYHCFADMVRIGQGKALRCFVVPAGRRP